MNPNAAFATLIPELTYMIHYPSPLFALFGLGGPELAVIIAIFGMVFGGIMGIAGMFFEHQRKKLAHDVTRLALEKGQPVPSDFAGRSIAARITRGQTSTNMTCAAVLCSWASASACTCF